MSGLDLSKLGHAGDYGALAHYADPAYYSKAYRSRRQDVDFYVALADRVGGPVLEYAVGNGRVALPLARSEHEVWGVDLSAPMLESLKDRLAKEGAEVQARVHLRYAHVAHAAAVSADHQRVQQRAAPLHPR